MTCAKSTDKMPKDPKQKYQKHFHRLPEPFSLLRHEASHPQPKMSWQPCKLKELLTSKHRQTTLNRGGRLEFYWFQHGSMSLHTTSVPIQDTTLSCATTTTSSTSTSSQQHKQARIHRNASQDLHQPPNNKLSTFLNKRIQRSPVVSPEHPKQIALQMAS